MPSPDPSVTRTVLLLRSVRTKQSRTSWREKERVTNAHVNFLKFAVCDCVYSPGSMCGSSHTHTFQLHTTRNVQQPQVDHTDKICLFSNIKKRTYYRVCSLFYTDHNPLKGYCHSCLLELPQSGRK